MTGPQPPAESRSGYAPDELLLRAVRGLPLVGPGDDLAELIFSACQADGITLMDQDILVVAQKIVSKAEARSVDLDSVDPGEAARRLAMEVDKDPALVQLILDESTHVIRKKPGVIIVEHRLGFVMANAGIDQSNADAGQAILLPLDPDASARRLALHVGRLAGCKLGVLIIDSFGRAWRNGTAGHAIGVAGFEPLIDRRGLPDLFGRSMQVTEIAIADEIAAAASALMGPGDEAKPLVLARGFRLLTENDVSIRSLLRNRDLDLFR